MNKTTEALKLAEEALDKARKGIPPGSGLYGEALAAIREALSEPTKNQFNPDWDAMAELVEENKRLAMENEKLRHGEIKYEDWLYNPMTGKPIWEEAEPVKQEPVGVVKVLKMHTDDSKFHYVDCQRLPEGTELYTAPVDAKAIRAKALEEAAKECDLIAQEADEMTKSKFVSEFGRALHEGMWGGATNCGVAIRGLK